MFGIWSQLLRYWQCLLVLIHQNGYKLLAGVQLVLLFSVFNLEQLLHYSSLTGDALTARVFGHRQVVSSPSLFESHDPDIMYQLHQIFCLFQAQPCGLVFSHSDLTDAYALFKYSFCLFQTQPCRLVNNPPIPMSNCSNHSHLPFTLFIISF